VVTDFKGGNTYLFGREILAATRGVHAEMLAQVQLI
jgi:hypothetical protein